MPITVTYKKGKYATFYAIITKFFIKKMSLSDERQKRLLNGYGEVQDIEYLDEHLANEVVPDLEFFLSQSVNDSKIRNLMKSLKCIKIKHGTFMECLYYVKKS